MKLIIFTDGASRGNPGKASYGFVILSESEKIIYKEGKAIGIATNNVAEYKAVLSSFAYVRDRIKKPSKLDIQVYTDSQLVANQLSGKYKIKNIVLGEIINKIKEIERRFLSVKYEHVYREENKLADKMANQALDELV